MRPLRQPPHLLWNAEIADTDLPEHGLHIGGEPVGKVLRETRRALSLGLQTVMHNKKMKRQYEKAAFERIGHPKPLIENGKPRLRHNRAIEFRGVR